MTGGRALYQVALADFRERVRGRSFLLVLAVTAWLGYTAVPSASANYSVMSFAGSRGVYSSAWVGTMVALYTSGFLSLPGFYLIRSAIERDRVTGAGQILAATSISRWSYVFGKALSNFLVLAAAVLIMALTAPAMQMIRGEDLTINLWQLWGPFLLFPLPMMALVSGLALIFEVVPWLRGTLGNVLYFFVWLAILTLPLMQIPGTGLAVGDASGLWSIYGRVEPVLQGLGLGHGGMVFLGNNRAIPVFHWQGLAWTPTLVGNRLVWFAVAAVLVWVAGLLFRRDDLAAADGVGARKARAHGRLARRSRTRGDARLEDPASDPSEPTAWTTWTSLPETVPARSGGRLAAMILQELRLSWRGLGRWWRVAASGLFIASLLAPLPTALGVILPLLWLLALPLWSGLGAREVGHGVDGLVFYNDHLLSRQLPALWLAGFSSGLMMALGLFLRLAATGDWVHLGTLVIGATFVPSLALALGVWTRGARTFEILYTVLWYMGPWEKLAPLDFTGSTDRVLTLHAPPGFLVAAVVALAMAVAGRWRQVYPC